MLAPTRPARWIISGLVVLLAACAADPPAVAIRPALVVKASAAGIPVEAYSGEVHAREEPQLAFRIGGKMSRRLVDVGAHVRAGQPLAELDPADVGLQSQASRAQLASAQSELSLARAELVRYKSLADQQLVSRSLYETRLAAVNAAQAQVNQARAQASTSANQVGYAVLRAPGDGVITQRLAEAGQVVAAGQPVFVLAVDGEREVLISIPEQVVSKLQVGQALVVELWAAPGKHFPGVLRELSPAADPATRTYAARASFDGGVSAELGQSARVYTQAPDASSIRVPLSALTQRAGAAAVWVVDKASSKVHLTPVKIGAYAEDGVPVLSGLRGDDWVVAAGAHLLLEGEQIAPIDRSNRRVHLDGPAAAAKTAAN